MLLKEIEYFISWESKDEECLFGFLRLRVSDDAGIIFNELENTSMIRELHVYGRTTPVNESSLQVQHLGIGKRLLKEAEKISRSHDKNKISVIAGIGTRNYYSKQGYNLVDTYMIKYLSDKPGVEISHIILDIIFIVIMYYIVFNLVPPATRDAVEWMASYY